MNRILQLVLFLFILTGGRLAAAQEARELHLLCWSEYVPETVIEGFEKKSHARVVIETYNSNEQMLARLRAKAGYYDLIQPSGFYVATLAKENELAPIDLSPHSQYREISIQSCAISPSIPTPGSACRGWRGRWGL